MPEDEIKLEQPALTVGRRTDGFFVLSFTTKPGLTNVLALDENAARWLTAELCFHLSRPNPPGPVKVESGENEGGEQP